MNNKENFKSRLGFILVSAGCAIGLGNVWKFPYTCGANGGAIFIMIYLLFLIFLGLPIMICEFSVGRASRLSVATCFENMEPEGGKYHLYKWLGMIGNYMLVFFYTTIGSWMLYYAYRSMTGEFVGKSAKDIVGAFLGMLGEPITLIMWMAIMGGFCFWVCKLGLQAGVEKVNKIMMVALLIVMLALAVNSLVLEGAGKGIEFYLVPDYSKVEKLGLGNVLYAALSQAFFTLSIGIGSMHIFGCSIDKARSIMGEASYIVALDTFVALVAGFIVIPACFAYGVEPGAGPGLVFITLPNIFAKMPGGIFWCSMFFIFMTFAAASTLIAVYENIISFGMEIFGWSRSKSAIINCFIILVGSLPVILGFNEWAWFQPLGKGTCVLDLEDFILSYNILPLGSLGYILFCTRKNGWGWQSFVEEANTGEGLQFSRGLGWYVSYVIPAVIIFIYLKGYYDLFSTKTPAICYTMYTFAFVLLSLIFYPAIRKNK